MVGVREVYRAINRLFDHKYILNNSYMFMWECDYFGITKYGYTYEVEIKVSKSDFKADFKKGKHDMFEIDCTVPQISKGRTNYSTISVEEAEIFGLEISDIQRKYNRIHAPVSVDISYRHPSVPNRFYFACPENLIDIKDIPDYAGLIYVSDSNTRIVKKAPFLHKRKFDKWHLLLDKFYYLSMRQKHELIDSKHNYLQLQSSYELITGEELEEEQMKIDFW